MIVSDFSAAVVIFVGNSENENLLPRCQGGFEACNSNQIEANRWHGQQIRLKPPFSI